MKAVFMSNSSYNPIEVEIMAVAPSTMTQDIQGRLLRGVVQFVFEKADGTDRVAFGTLKPELLPPVETKAEGMAAPKPPVPDVQKYFDLEAKAWRSFNLSKLKTIF